MKIEKNTTVTLQYTLTDKEGNLLDSCTEKEPFQYVHGSGGIISGLENELTGRDKGDKFSLVIAPGQAYGDRDDQVPGYCGHQ